MWQVVDWKYMSLLSSFKEFTHQVNGVSTLTAAVAKVSTSASVCIHDPTYICSVI